MKNIKIVYVALIALIAGVFGACTNFFEPGPQVNGPQIYFSANNALNVDIVDSPESATQKITVCRIDASDYLEVFIISEVEKRFEKYFTIPEIVTFEPGEKSVELLLNVDYKSLVEGEKYVVNFIIADELGDQTTPYGYSEMKVTYALNPWQLVNRPDDEKGQGKLRGLSVLDKMLKGINTTLEIETDVYRHSIDTMKYMVKEPWINLLQSFYADLGYTFPISEFKNAFDYSAQNLIIDCTDTLNVNIAWQKMGILDKNNWWSDEVNLGDFHYKAEGGTFKDGVISFPKGSFTCTCDYYRALGYADDDPSMCAGANMDGLFRLVLPGYEGTDYAISFAYDGMEVPADNKSVKAKFAVSYGNDVTGIKYLFVEGNVERDPSAALAKLEEGTDENILTVEDFVKGGETTHIKVELKKGIYTLVAAPLNKEGELSTKDAFVVSFYYPGLGDNEEHPCEIYCQIRPASDAIEPDYISLFPDYKSLAFRIYGHEIKDCKILLMSKENFEAYMAYYEMTADELVNNMGDSLIDKLDLINNGTEDEGGYINATNSLESDTEYILAVSATNNYGESAFASATYTTAKIPYDGVLSLGRYQMSCTYTSESNESGKEGDSLESVNIFKVEPVIGSTTELIFKQFAIESSLELYGTYDEAKNTITLDGRSANISDESGADVKVFGSAIQENLSGYFYGIFSYMVNERDEDGYLAGNGKDAIVLTVDPETKQIKGLTNYLVMVNAFKPSDLSFAGQFNIFEGTKTTIAPYVKGGSSSENGGEIATQSVRLPFSSVKIDRRCLSMPKSAKCEIAPYMFKSVEKKAVKSVKPLSVERYTPAKREIKLSANFAR